MSEQWKVRIKANCNTIENKRRRIDRQLFINQDLNIKDNVLIALSHIKKFNDFLGCPIFVETPLHNTEYILEYERGGKGYYLKCVS